MSAPEEWRPVVGFEGLYEVSSFGRVRSLDRVIDVVGRWGTPERRRYKGRLLRPQFDQRSPYWRVVLTVNSTKTGHCVHALVLAAFVGPCPEGQEALHRDCDSRNNALVNLRYGTRTENREDSRAAGTLAVGERIAQHKLTTEEVIRIRETPGTHQAIADAYGVSRKQIGRIKNRENWSHV